MMFIYYIFQYLNLFLLLASSILTMHLYVTAVFIDLVMHYLISGFP